MKRMNWTKDHMRARLLAKSVSCPIEFPCLIELCADTVELYRYLRCVRSLKQLFGAEIGVPVLFP